MLFFCQCYAFARCKNAAWTYDSRENPSSFVIRTRIMFVHPFGDYTLPGDPFSPLTRKLCRYPGADVRAISEILQHATWRGREREKESEREGELWELEQPGLRCVAKTREGTRWEGMQSMWQAYSDEIYMHTLREYYAGTRWIHIHAYFISAAGKLLFPRPSGDGIRVHSCIIKRTD